MISMGMIVASRSIPVAGHDFDQRIVAHLKREHRALIGEQTAEQIKLQIGSASPHQQEKQTETLARDLSSELLKTVLSLFSSRLGK